jgi:hypothetical protein
MKTTAMILTMMLMVSFINANTVNDPTRRLNKLEKQVSRLIDFPNDLSVPAGSSVSVEFELKEDGSVMVNEISGQPELTTYVKNKLENFAAKKMKELVGEKFYYKFVFKK